MVKKNLGKKAIAHWLEWVLWFIFFLIVLIAIGYLTRRMGVM